MNKYLFKLLTAVLGLSLSIGVVAETAPYPLENFAARASIRSVSLSPDGSKLSLMRIAARGENPVLEIYETSDLTKAPFRVNAAPMEITGYYWVSNTNIVMTFRQKVRDRIEGFNRGVYEYLFGKLDVERKKVRHFREQSPSIVSILPTKPEKVLISFQPKDMAGLDPRYRPLSYYEFDLKTERKKLVLRGSPSIGGVRFDKDGNPRLATKYDRKTGNRIVVVRDKGGSEWREVYENDSTSFESFSVRGVDPQNENHLMVVAHNGSDTRGLWTFDPNTKKFVELLYKLEGVDVRGTVTHSNRWTNPNEIVGVTYATDKVHTEYFDGSEGALNKQLHGLIPNAHSVSIASRSKAGNTLAVFNRGPRDPGSYYLIHKGKISKIGSTKPKLKASGLSDVKYVTYQSRDGHERYAYATIPNGKGPFPTIVMPHGGPFVGEVVGFDEWSQMLANNGYMVIQPQYRGSHGYGINYYTSAFLPKGLGGYEMQDDKDDAALHMVNEGLADKDRLAMFGWSYGGYAALIAASREEQIYQCAIAGAAVSDNKLQLDYYRDFMREGSTSYQEQINFWTDSISPINVVSKVNIPLLMIHGSVDQRVPIEHAVRYLDEAKKTGTKVRYVELEGADHFSNTLFYNHKKKLYESIIGFLKTDCW